MSTKRLGTLLAFLVATMLVAGCATPITVTSDPPGAAVYARGNGRPSYRWKYRGNTPVTFTVSYNATQTFVRWPDGKRSETQYSSLMGEPDAALHFKRPSTPKPVN